MSLTESQKELAKSLAKTCERLCKEHHLRRQGCRVEQFETVIERYGERVPQLTVELEQCILWCVGKQKKLFTCLRFHNWCRNKVKWSRQSVMRESEIKNLRNGTDYQKQDYSRIYQ